MEQEINKNSLNKKNEFAFSAIMFFAPLVKNNLKTTPSLSDQDISFISWYVKLWYFNIILLIISIVFWILQFSTNNIIFQKISIAFLIILALSLCLWTILVALNKNINTNLNSKTTNDVNFDLILYFVPIYNIYIWYNNHQFEWDNSMIKSSILLWILFTMSSIFVPNNYVNIIILVLILFKIICTINWINFWAKRNNAINNSFQKNPEEIRWYLSWSVMSLFNKNWIKNNIYRQKEFFEFLFKIDNSQIVCEYIMLWVVCLIGICIWIMRENYFLVVWDIMIVLRYMIMAIKWRHLPHLPIFRELISLFFKSNITKNE